MRGPFPGVCFFGCGQMATKHAKTLRRLFPAIPLSFASRDLSRARGAAAKFKGARAFGGYREAAESSGPEVAFLTTPQAFHAPLAVLCAEHGKHLIIEKPVTRTMAELDVIEGAVERAGVRCTVAENYYYKPFLTRLTSLLAAGAVGTVLFIELSKTNRERKTGWRTDEELMGGGALLEGGVHWVNLLTSLAGGRPLEVTAFKPQVSYETNVPLEDSLLTVVRYSNGVVGKLLHSWRVPNRFFGLGLSKIYGTEGVITFESNGLFYSSYGRSRKKGLLAPWDFLGFRPMLKAFVEDFQAGRPWRPALARIRQDMEVVHAAYRSILTGRGVGLPLEPGSSPPAGTP